MFYKYGYYFSEKKLKKDKEFLKSQKLSDQQIDAVADHLQKRLAKNTTTVAIFMALAFFIIITVDFLAEVIPVLTKFM